MLKSTFLNRDLNALFLMMYKIEKTLMKKSRTKIAFFDRAHKECGVSAVVWGVASSFVWARPGDDGQER